MSEVVVGIDGSDESAAVLRWALDEAVLRGAALKIVCATHSPATWLGMGEALGSAVTATLSEDDLTAFARSTIDEVMGQVGDTGGVVITKDARIGNPADVLVEASHDADLLVVGSRGHGDLGSVLLGSVGMHCVHHSHCPVVVIPSPEKR